MLPFIKNIRNAAIGFVRGMVERFFPPKEIAVTLDITGLAYPPQQVREDIATFIVQKVTVDEIRTLNKAYLIPEALHIQSPRDLTAKYMYDVQCLWEDVEGNIATTPWSVISDQRMTQDEIMEIATTFPPLYVPEGFEFHGEIDIIASWSKK